MAWAEIGEYIPCKRCGSLFEKRGWNAQYCPDCQGPRHKELAMRNYYAKQGRRIRQGNNWSDGKDVAICDMPGLRVAYER